MSCGMCLEAQTFHESQEFLITGSSVNFRDHDYQYTSNL